VSKMNAGDFASIGFGLVIMAYVVYCLINQKFWNRRAHAWATSEEYPKIFKLNIIIGTITVIWTVVKPFN